MCYDKRVSFFIFSILLPWILQTVALLSPLWLIDEGKVGLFYQEYRNGTQTQISK